MTKWSTLGLCAALLAGAAALRAQEPPGAQEAQGAQSPERAWLERLAGEWTTEGEAVVDPSQPPVRSTGTESIRRLGDSWAVSTIESSFLGAPFSAVFTLGWDAGREELVGTWIDSASGRRWHYQGGLDEGGTTVTLSKGSSCPGTGDAQATQRDLIELDGAGGKTHTSQVLVDGEWVTVLTVRSERKE